MKHPMGDEVTPWPPSKWLADKREWRRPEFIGWANNNLNNLYIYIYIYTHTYTHTHTHTLQKIASNKEQHLKWE